MLRLLVCSLVAAVAALMISLPAPARAGGCTPCESSAECVAMFGEPAYCVRFSAPTGCGALMQYCCPGQGCAAMESGPSCAPDCVVVDGADAGPSGSDAGPSGSDAGPSGSDAGPSGSDAGPGVDGGPRPDGSVAGMDGGMLVITDRERGCCTVAPGVGRFSIGTAFGLGLVAVCVVARVRRRRRR